MSFSQNRTFLRNDAIVFPHIPNVMPLKELIAHITNDSDIDRVLPERIAPSAMMPSESFTGELSHHQLRILRCFFENGRNVKYLLIVTAPIVRSGSVQSIEETVVGRSFGRSALFLELQLLRFQLGKLALYTFAVQVDYSVQ